MPHRNLHQIEAVFHGALAVSPAERPDYLMQACNGDQSLYEEVSSLISALGTDDDFMEQPALSFGMTVLSHLSEESMIGKSVGSYQILSRLGKGGMGEVYLAEDSRLGRKVALKFLSNEFLEDEWAKRQLLKEAQAAAILDHPNICSVYGIEEVEGRSFIVMQFINGQTLAELIRKKTIKPQQVPELARQIASALAEAHSHGIIHRDMKPGNIMVTSAGQVKVLDFGLAQTVHQSKRGDDSQSTRTGVLAGTVAYMSPEQLRNEKLTFSTDIFSLGVVLYELVAGEKPFARASQADTISAILTDTAPALGNRRHAHQLDHFIHKCLEKDRDKRYQSANELLDELVRESATRWRLPLRPFRHAGVSTLLAAVLMLMLGSVFFLYPRFQKRDVKEATKNTLPTTPQPKFAAATFSLAVMPITSSGLAKFPEYLTDGLTQDFIDRLASLTQVRVIPFSSIADYKGKDSDLIKLGTELNVDAVLQSDFVQRGKRTFLESKLVKVSDGAVTKVYTGEIRQEAVQDLGKQLVDKVIESLNLHLDNERKFFNEHGTRSPEAFRQYILGRYYWRNRNEDNIKKAIGYFNAALSYDRLYARAYAGLADSYVLLSTVSFGKIPTDEAMSQASANARQALEIDPDLPEAHDALGLVNLRYHWNWQDAELSFKAAIAADPNYAPAHYWYSHLLLILGRNDEAVEESKKAKFLDPSVPSKMNHCRVLANAGQVDPAEKCFAELVPQNPQNDHLRYLQGLFFQRIGRALEALQIFENLYAKNRALAGAALGYAYGKANRTADALRVLKEMTELSKQRYVPPQEFALIYVGLGDNDNAFFWLERAYQERFAGLIYFNLEPMFKSLRSDPRYDTLTARINLPRPKT